MANRLQYEKSPYLLQHKEDPVDWYPWGKEAFQKAAKEDKPVFLSIGYSTCHWCHVMARESFRDLEVARFLNEHYVSIKVDREERPDIDGVYMEVCQNLTGSGGWPLTIIMSADQKPFFAGTYFPKEAKYGHPGIIDVLRRVRHVWDTQRRSMLLESIQILAILKEGQRTDREEPERGLLQKAYRQLRRSFDNRWGGFGPPPRFPTPHNLMFLLEYGRREGDKEAAEMAEKTLLSMARGGILDQIGGGFSRYSTDEMWLVPHFEKMLYDNALLILAYLDAYQHTGKEEFAQVAGWTAEYILEELTDPEGGFYCGQDADSEGEEGKYYLLTPAEVKKVLGEEDGADFCRRYDITETGNFEGKNIPNRLERSEESWMAGDPRLQKLRAYRRQRVKLHRDEKILLSWNGWAIIALLRAGLILGWERYTQAAEKAMAFIENKMTDERGRLLLRYYGGEAGQEGQLEDYAVYTLALLTMYQTTLRVEYLEQAIRRAEQMVDLFEDAQRGGYYISPFDGEKLILRRKESYDGAMPSGNSVVAMVLEELAGLTGENKWRERADRQHCFVAGQGKEYPAGCCYGLLAMSKVLYPQRKLVIVGDKVPEVVWMYLRKHFAGEVYFLFKSSGNEVKLGQVVPFTAAYPIPETGEEYYLCENSMCREPVREFPLS